jgi:hypothetical protein
MINHKNRLGTTLRWNYTKLRSNYAKPRSNYANYFGKFSFKKVDPERVGMTKSVIIRHMTQGGLNDMLQKQIQTQLLILFSFNCKPLSIWAENICQHTQILFSSNWLNWLNIPATWWVNQISWYFHKEIFVPRVQNPFKITEFKRFFFYKTTFFRRTTNNSGGFTKLHFFYIPGYYKYNYNQKPFNHN